MAEGYKSVLQLTSLKALDHVPMTQFERARFAGVVTALESLLTIDEEAVEVCC